MQKKTLLLLLISLSPLLFGAIDVSIAWNNETYVNSTYRPALSAAIFIFFYVCPITTFLLLIRLVRHFRAIKKAPLRVPAF